MSLPEDDAAVLSARWTEGVLLKRDVFSTVERGRFRSDTGEVDAVLRRLDQVPWWSYIPARHLFARERRALALARDLHVGPELLWAGRQALVRGFIDGVALHLAKPHGDVAYFRSAKQALRKLHRAGICHNDLAKEQNWLRGSDGRAYLTDFQLAACFKTRGRLFRIAAYEDLRHLLKHKRSYAPEALTPKERKILARKSLVASIWLKTGKKVYRAITRGLFNFTDREGGGRRLVNDAPVLIDLIRKNPAVRDTAIVAFADRRTGVGLYAFVEADQTALEAQLRTELTAAKGPKPPEHIQVVQALPRDAAGKPRTEILQLVAMNQLDLIEPMMTSETDRAFLKNILESRKNLRDRFNFEAADLAPPQRTSSPAKAGESSAGSLENARDRDARHNVHSVRSLERDARHERIAVRARHPLEIAGNQRQRQEHRPHLRRHARPAARRPSSDVPAPRRSIDPAPRAALGSPCPQTPLPCRCRVAPAIAAARTTGAARRPAAAPRSPAAMPCASPAWRARCSISGGLPPGNPGAERKQRRRGIVDVAFQRRHGRHRIVVEIELMLVDQPRQPLDRQTAVRGSPALSSAATGLPSTPPWPAPASMSVHHCRRISPGSGWLTCSRTREISTLKA